MAHRRFVVRAQFQIRLLGYPTGSVVEQIVGRERRERVSQLTWCGEGCFDSRRRVNSTVRWLSNHTRRIIWPEAHMNYKVVVNESEEGFSVSCPGLPGCWSQGQTESEALENIQDAIREYLAAIDELVKGQDVREVRVAI